MTTRTIKVGDVIYCRNRECPAVGCRNLEVVSQADSLHDSLGGMFNARCNVCGQERGISPNTKYDLED